MKRERLVGALALHLVSFIFLSLSANAEAVRVADCERDAKLDFWAAADNEFCVAIMNDVFKSAGIETTRVEFGEDHLLDVSKADVICSAFRTKKLLEDFDFPQQPLGRMHFALYATPSVPHEEALGGFRLPAAAARAHALRALRDPLARDGAHVHEDHRMAAHEDWLLARVAGADIERRPHEVLRACAALADVRGDSDERRRGAGAARR